MRTETFYKITTLVTLSLLALLLVGQMGTGSLVNVASADPSSVGCVKGKNGIKGKGCDGTVTLQLGPGGVINSTKGYGLRVNNTSANTGTAALYGKEGSTDMAPYGLKVAVQGDSVDGVGVLGRSLTADGVRGISSSSGYAGVFAQANSASDPAIRLFQGGISVTGAGEDTNTPVFVHKVILGFPPNTQCVGKNYATVLDNPLTNGRSNAILIVTPNYGADNNSTGAPAVGPYAVFYDATGQCGKGAGRWVIYTLNSAAMVHGSRINVLVVNP